jgi:hypothetical protein
MLLDPCTIIEAEPPVVNLNAELSVNNINKLDISEFQEDEIEARNQGNDLVHYFDLAADNETSDSENESNEDKPIHDVWPIFSGNISASEEFVKHRQLKSGNKVYQQPVVNPNSSSQKLLPAAIPKQTKHDRKKRRIQALGNNNTMFENYFIQSENSKAAPKDPAINPNLESETLKTPINVNSNPTPMSESVNARLACLVEKRLSAPKKTEHASKEKKSHDRWEALNSALNAATEQYKQKDKKDKKFKFPKSMMSNIYQFNNLQLKYTLDGTPSPGATTSFMAAQSAINQCLSGNAPPKSRSGIYLSCSIRREAKHILNNQQLSDVNKGNWKNHKSLLDNVELRKSLFSWAATQVPGHVSCTTHQV